MILILRYALHDKLVQNRRLSHFLISWHVFPEKKRKHDIKGGTRDQIKMQIKRSFVGDLSPIILIAVNKSYEENRAVI